MRHNVAARQDVPTARRRIGCIIQAPLGVARNQVENGAEGVANNVRTADEL